MLIQFSTTSGPSPSLLLAGSFLNKHCRNPSCRSLPIARDRRRYHPHQNRSLLHSLRSFLIAGALLATRALLAIIPLIADPFPSLEIVAATIPSFKSIRYSIPFGALLIAKALLATELEACIEILAIFAAAARGYSFKE